MRSQILTMTLLTLMAGAPVLAGDHDHGKPGGKGPGNGSVFCPHCGTACYPTVTKAKETRVCFETEIKTICIPKVRFPWQGAGLNLSFRDSQGKGKGSGKGCGGKGCGRVDCGGKDVDCRAAKCGRTRDVNVMIKHEYECSVCKYTWDPASFKNGTKKDDKYFGAPEPSGGPGVTPPPATEARRRAPGDDERSARVEPARQAVPSFFSSFFK